MLKPNNRLFWRLLRKNRVIWHLQRQITGSEQVIWLLRRKTAGYSPNSRLFSTHTVQKCCFLGSLYVCMYVCMYVHTTHTNHCDKTANLKHQPAFLSFKPWLGRVGHKRPLQAKTPVLVWCKTVQNAALQATTRQFVAASGSKMNFFSEKMQLFSINNLAFFHCQQLSNLFLQKLIFFVSSNQKLIF